MPATWRVRTQLGTRSVTANGMRFDGGALIFWSVNNVREYRQGVRRCVVAFGAGYWHTVEADPNASPADG